MFGLLNNGKVCDPGEFLELISQKSAPNFFWSDDSRKENRNNRTIPVVVTPWVKNRPDESNLRVALTKDVSNYGICLTSTAIFDTKEIAVGFHLREFELEEPLYFHCHVRTERRLAEGFWQIGVEATELLNQRFAKRFRHINELAISMLTPGETKAFSGESVE